MISTSDFGMIQKSFQQSQQQLPNGQQIGK